MPPPTAIPQFLDEGTVVVTSARTAINARTGPGTEFDRVAVLPPASRLLVTGNSDDGEWVQVRLADGADVFIFRDLVTVDTSGAVPTLAPSATEPTPTDVPTETPTVTPTATPIPLDAEGLVARVTARNAVNVRTGPSRAFQVIAPLRPGSVVNVLGSTEDSRWLEIQLPDGRTGFMIADANEILLGEQYFDQATATAIAGGDANLPTVREATVVPTLPVEEDDDVPGRVALPDGSTVRPRGFENVNVRERPVGFAPVVDLLPSGDVADALILSADQRWVLIENPNGEGEGWVSRLAVILVTPAEQGITTGTPLPTDTPTPTATNTPEPTATTEGEARRSVNTRYFSRVRPMRHVLQQTAGEGSGTITAGANANVRGGAGLEFEIVGTVQPNEIVPVLSIVGDNEWVEIRLQDDTVGFISGALIDITEEPDETATEEAETTPDPTQESTLSTVGEGAGTVNGEDEIDVLRGPGEDFEVIATVEGGTEVGVRGLEVSAETNATWVRVRLADDTIGYLNANDLVVTEFPTLSEVFDGAPPGEADEEIVVEASSTEEAPAATEDAAETEDAPQPTATAEPTDAPAAQSASSEGSSDGEGSADVLGDEDVDVRQGPGIDFDVIATVSGGDSVPVRGLEGNDDGETWVRVRLSDGTIGYIDAGAVNVTEFPTLNETFAAQVVQSTPIADTPGTAAFSAAPPSDGEGAGSGTILGDDTVEVRLGPGAGFEVINSVEPDTEVMVRGLDGGDDGETWVRVQLEDGIVGYVNATNINVTEFPEQSEPFRVTELQVRGEDDTDDTAPTAVAQANTPAPADSTAEATEDTTAAQSAEGTPVADASTDAEAEAEAEAEAQAQAANVNAVQVGEFDASLERQTFAVRLGLIVAAVIIGFGGLVNVFTARRKG